MESFRANGLNLSGLVRRPAIAFGTVFAVFAALLTFVGPSGVAAAADVVYNSQTDLPPMCSQLDPDYANNLSLCRQLPGGVGQAYSVVSQGYSWEYLGPRDWVLHVDLKLDWADTALLDPFTGQPNGKMARTDFWAVTSDGRQDHNPFHNAHPDAFATFADLSNYDGSVAGTSQQEAFQHCANHEVCHLTFNDPPVFLPGQAQWLPIPVQAYEGHVVGQSPDNPAWDPSPAPNDLWGDVARGPRHDSTYLSLIEHPSDPAASRALTGAVTDGVGNPIGGATVTATGGPQGSTTLATSGLDGRYSLTLPGGGYSVSIHDDKGNAYDPAAAAVDLSAGDKNVPFQLVQQVLSGRVYASTCGVTCTRTGLDGIPVAVTGTSVSSTKVSVNVATASDGTWSQHVPRGSYDATPTSTSRVFNPDKRTLTVNQDLSGIDFATCASGGPASSQALAQGARNPDPAAKVCQYGLDWTMPDRLTPELAQSWPAEGGGLPQASYIYPPNWKAAVVLTQSGQKVTRCPSDVVWTWAITTRPAGAGKATLSSKTGCGVNLLTPTLGTFTITGTQTKRGTTKAIKRATGNIVVKDWLIAAVGDSNGSGEGNPKFFNTQCNRSTASYQFQTALRLERADNRSSVTLIWPACSGARVEHLTNRNYAGIRPDHHSALLPQLEQVRQAIDNPLHNSAAQGRAPRTVDAVITSIGVNDLSFGGIITYCTRDNTSNTNCNQSKVSLHKSSDGSTSFASSLSKTLKSPTLDNYVRGAIKRLPGLYATYKQSVVASLHVDPHDVLMTTYPDFTTYTDGKICGRPGEAYTFPKFSVVEWSWLQVMGTLLNKAVDASHGADGFTNVDGIAPRFIGHGYCAKDSYIQGVVKQALNHNADGAFHPDSRGHAISADANFTQLCLRLYDNKTCKSPNPAATKPTTTPQPSYTSRHNWIL